MHHTTFFMTIVALLGLYTGQAQNSGIITYKKSLLHSIIRTTKGKKMLAKHPDRLASLENLDQQIRKELATLRFKLSYHQDAALFSIDSTTLDVRSAYHMPAIQLGLSSPVTYTEAADTQSYSFTTLNNTSYMVIQPQQEWKRSRKSKDILSYECFKATTYIIDDKGKKINITAWYAPRLLHTYGIGIINGLEGIILELSYGDLITFKAEKIQLLPDQQALAIQPPHYDELITLEEYELRLALAQKQNNKKP